MRKGIIFAFILILASSFVMADNTYFQGGAGGFETIYLPLDLNKIDVKLNNIRLPELPNNVYLTGGGGWGNVGNNVRIGGFGYGGSIPAISSKNQEITREFDMEISFGGLTVEKAFHPFSFGEITMGFVVGGGAIKLELNRWSD
ncbi:MAG: hypothetical protein K9M80_03115, partial [Candidatus Marinimicrobia bacterium]|nr:hypothetical protein [Candidatus Neomarinimicrobiota bacterium]